MKIEKATPEEILAVLKEILDKVNSGWSVNLNFNLSEPVQKKEPKP